MFLWLTMLSWGHKLSAVNTSRGADSTEARKCPNSRAFQSGSNKPDNCVLGEVIKFLVYGHAQGKASCTFISCPPLQICYEGLSGRAVTRAWVQKAYTHIKYITRSVVWFILSITHITRIISKTRIR